MINDSLYSILAGDNLLISLLAAHKVDPSIPAIYENWAAENTPRPYMNLTYVHDIGDEHFAKDIVTANVDIFTDGDTVQAEAIRRRVIQLLDRQIVPDAEEGEIRYYLTGEGIIDEDDPAVCHWNVEFQCILWRNEFVRYLESID